MTESRKYFDLEIDDVISFYVGHDKCEYPLTFTVEECIEEYCAMRDMDLIRIVRDDDDGQLRSGKFWSAGAEE